MPQFGSFSGDSRRRQPRLTPLPPAPSLPRAPHPLPEARASWSLTEEPSTGSASSLGPGPGPATRRASPAGSQAPAVKGAPRPAALPCPGLPRGFAGWRRGWQEGLLAEGSGSAGASGPRRRRSWRTLARTPLCPPRAAGGLRGSGESGRRAPRSGSALQAAGGPGASWTGAGISAPAPSAVSPTLASSLPGLPLNFPTDGCHRDPSCLGVFSAPSLQCEDRTGPPSAPRGTPGLLLCL